jgi:hypothetical protein
MNRTQHYERAEELLLDARTEPDGFRRRLILAEAQVHATLALSAPAGKGSPGPGQDEAADTKSTGATHPARPAGQPHSLSPGTLTPARPAGQPKVTGHRPDLPLGQEAVRRVAPAAPAGYVRTGPGPEPAADDPSQPEPRLVREQPKAGEPAEEEPGDPGDQKLRGPEEQKPGGFRPS